MSNIVSSVLPKIPAVKVYICTISPFPYYNGNGQVELDKVMVAINQPSSGLHKELMHKLEHGEIAVGDFIHLTNLSMTLVVVAVNPYYRFEKVKENEHEQTNQEETTETSTSKPNSSECRSSNNRRDNFCGF